MRARFVPASRVAGLGVFERRDLGGCRAAGRVTEKPYGMRRDDAVSRQDDEPVLVAAPTAERAAFAIIWSVVWPPGGERDRPPASRSSTPGVVACGWTEHLPGPAAAAGIADGDEQRRELAPPTVDRQVAERERLRIGEDERRVGRGEIREPGALDQHRRLDRPARCRPTRARPWT